MRSEPLRDGPTLVEKFHGFSPELDEVTFEKLWLTDTPAFRVGA